MMAGRPPTPAHMKLVKGTHDASRHGDKPEAKAKKASTPAPALKVPNAPAWMTAGGKREWRRVCKILTGIIDERDRGMMAQYCFMYSRLEEEPYSFTATDHAQFRMLQNDLGLSPAGRKKLAMLAQGDAPKNDDPDGWNDL